jgi:hypothetical protein
MAKAVGILLVVLIADESRIVSVRHPVEAAIGSDPHVARRIGMDSPDKVVAYAVQVVLAV